MPKKVASLDNLKSHGDVEKVDGKILFQTVVQRLKLDTYGMQMLLIGETCTSLSDTPQVGVKR